MADSYVDAFYELAVMLNIGALPISPAQAWREHMRPMIEQLLTIKDDGCCHKTRLKGSPCPIGWNCPHNALA